MKYRILISPVLIAACCCLPVLGSGVGFFNHSVGARDTDGALVCEEIELISEIADACEALSDNMPPEEVSAPAALPAESVSPAPSTFYTSVGRLTYYRQNDEQWAGYLYGGQDPLNAFGCGPTVMSMLVTSFTNESFTPPAMADWAVQNGYWAPASGSLHALIPEGLTAFGMKAESYAGHSADDVINALKKGHIFVALMGYGHFSDSGHFIIISDYYSGSYVSIVDPASSERSQTPWDINLIMSELYPASDSGAPLWIVQP